jgi:DNA-binding transcriptional ArsR family regulator
MDPDRLVRVAHALGDGTRASLWLQLGRERWAICALAGTFGLASSTVSHHVGVLADAGLVRVVRSGRYALVERVSRPAMALLRAAEAAGD